MSTEKILIRMCVCASCSESSLAVLVRSYVFWNCGSDYLSVFLSWTFLAVSTDIQKEIKYEMSQRTTKPTIRLLRSAKTQISLRICAVWSEYSLIAYAFYSLQATQRGLNPCHTGLMYRLIWAVAGNTGLMVGFVVGSNVKHQDIQGTNWEYKICKTEIDWATSIKL